MPRKQPQADKQKADNNAKVAPNGKYIAPNGKLLFAKGHTYGFKKGQSGNPTGIAGKQPKDKEAKKLAQSLACNAIGVLQGIMENEEASSSARVTAALGILDRGLGKPVQPIENGKPGDFSDVADEDLDAFILNETSEYLKERQSVNA